MFLTLLLACLEPSPDDTLPDDTGADSASPDDTGTAAVACGDAVTMGTLELSFSMEPDYIPSMDEPPAGIFYGAFYSASDVTNTGPAAGAEPWAQVILPGVDLTDPVGGPTAVLGTTDPLPACEVVLLGFLDSDDNDIDAGDPVTFPVAPNTVTVVAHTSTPFTAFFGLTNPG